MLVCASSVFYVVQKERSGHSSSVHNLEISTVLNRCVHYNEASNILSYASTTEAFPGLLFYAMLNLGSESCGSLTRDRENAYDENHPGVSSPLFFRERADRKAFFDVFGVYCNNLPTLKSSRLNTFTAIVDNVNDCKGMRTMSRLREVGRAAAKDIGLAKAAYISLLGQFCKKNRWPSEAERQSYFKSTWPNKAYHPLTTFHINQVDFSAFYTSPILFSSRNTFVILDKGNSKEDTTSKPETIAMEFAAMSHANVTLFNEMSKHLNSESLSDVSDILPH